VLISSCRVIGVEKEESFQKTGGAQIIPRHADSEKWRGGYGKGGGGNPEDQSKTKQGNVSESHDQTRKGMGI
jgi:hypothetical protein